MQDDARGLPVVVVGGGVGGVATALALGRQGRRVSLLEQADQIGAIGYGVQIGPNVLPMLEHLGVGRAALDKAYLPTEIHWCELATGEPLLEIPLRTEEFARRYGGSSYLAIHRVDLHELLLAACKELPHVELNQSTTVAAYRQEGDRVAAVTADGREIEAAAIIAADGLRSRLRAQMHPGDVPRDTGYVAHRTIVPMDEAPVPRATAGGGHDVERTRLPRHLLPAARSHRAEHRRGGARAGRRRCRRRSLPRAPAGHHGRRAAGGARTD